MPALLCRTYFPEVLRCLSLSRARSTARCTVRCLTLTSAASALLSVAAQRARRSRSRRISRSSNRRRALSAPSRRSARAGRAPVSAILIQSTGHGSTHNSHPVQSRAITVCINPAAPTIASTGHAWMHSVQPIQSASSITATAGGLVAPKRESTGLKGTPSSAASSRAPSSPPGGHWLASAHPVASASAYGRQPR